MTRRPTFEEISGRIDEVKVAYAGTLPTDHALAWEGYIGALLEWGLIDADVHGRLQNLLPRTPVEPALTIFLGLEGARETIETEPSKVVARMASARV